MFCNGITPRLADPDRIETAGLTLSSDSSCRVAVITDLCQASLLRAPPVRHHRQRGILSSRQNSVNRPPLPASAALRQPDNAARPLSAHAWIDTPRTCQRRAYGV
jgi:hypothetical protein